MAEFIFSKVSKCRLVTLLKRDNCELWQNIKNLIVLDLFYPSVQQKSETVEVSAYSYLLY